MGRLLLKNCTLLNEEGVISSNQNLLISKGIINKISSGDIIVDSDTEVMNCTDLVISPGFVNLHTHSPMNIFKGLAEDVNENDWFNKEIWPYESLMDSEDVYAGARLAICEMLHKGVTAFADHYFQAEMICKAVVETGIRGDIAPTLFGMAGAYDEQLYASSELIKKYDRKNPRLDLRLGPHAPYTCSPDDLAKTADMAKSLGKGVHIHVSDAQSQIQSSIDQYGRTPFQILADTGVMARPLIVGHGLWILDEEIESVTDDTWFAVCPKTYMKLSIGMGRVWKWHDKLPLCIGTDGAASSNGLDPLEQLRLFLLIGKFNLNNAEDFTLKEGWKMIMRGHEALNFHSGKLKEGFAADLLFWDLNHISTLPLYNPLAGIIYSSSAENIIHSMIAGNFVKKEGRVLLDLYEIKKYAVERASSILKKGKGKTNLIF